MNFGLLWEFLEGLSFHRGVWLFLPAFALHVLEEAPQFTAGRSGEDDEPSQ